MITELADFDTVERIMQDVINTASLKAADNNVKVFKVEQPKKDKETTDKDVKEDAAEPEETNAWLVKEAFQPNFDSAQEYINFLENTLIPDLTESGNDSTVEDFEQIIDAIKDKDVDEEFISLLKHLERDHRESGTDATADDYAEGVYWIKKSKVKKESDLKNYEEMQKLMNAAFAEEILSGKDVSLQCAMMGDHYTVMVDRKKSEFDGPEAKVKKMLEEKIKTVGTSKEAEYISLDKLNDWFTGLSLEESDKVCNGEVYSSDYDQTNEDSMDDYVNDSWNWWSNLTLEEKKEKYNEFNNINKEASWLSESALTPFYTGDKVISMGQINFESKDVEIPAGTNGTVISKTSDDDIVVKFDGYDINVPVKNKQIRKAELKKEAATKIDWKNVEFRGIDEVYTNGELYGTEAEFYEAIEEGQIEMTGNPSDANNQQANEEEIQEYSDSVTD